jgi:tetratricopeptide (TPR) repeat protein
MKVTTEGKAVFPTEPCLGREKMIVAAINGDLAAPEERAILDHVEHCPGCSSFLRLQEKIDDEFRSCFVTLTGRETIDEALPERLRIVLGNERKRNLGMWLYNLGRAILFQQPEAVDTIHPVESLIPVDMCYKKLGMFFDVSLKDPLLERTGLTHDLARDCSEFVDRMQASPKELFRVRNAKEAFDRSLAVLPDFVPAVKSIGNYYFIRKDFQSCLCEYNSALSLVSDRFAMWELTVALSAASNNLNDFANAYNYLDRAVEIQESPHIDFHRFVNDVWTRQIDRACASLIRMDRRIVAQSPSSRDHLFIALVAKMFKRKEQFFRETFRTNSKMCRLFTKYIEFV